VVFDLERCHITAAPLNDLWQELRRLRHFLPANLDQLVLRLDRSGGRHLLFRAKGSAVWIHADKLARALADAGQRTSLWWQPEGGASRIVAGDAAPAPDVFEQVHPDMADRARCFAVEQAGEVEGCTVWDLYAGVGDTTAALARQGARVHSVELDRRAVAYAEAAGPSAQRHVGPAEALVATLPTPERVIVNPPRMGMDRRVAAALLHRRPQRIVYVSCDPATLARDLARLAAGYSLVQARCFDLFPQTAHVETVAVLESA
jgi:tRNA/tmRNA/rRNA uracil-C5-methylase (TrmA/RlmC/RlmD family)